jgi:uncharacterized membrane protein (DUF4010 family)
MIHHQTALCGSMFDVYEWTAQIALALHLLAAFAAGLLVGIERGWRQRDENDGARVAGVRTFTLVGGCGGLISIVAAYASPILAAILLAALLVLLLVAFLWPRSAQTSRDATTMVAAIITLGLGLLAGAGLAALALAGAAITTFLLALRKPMHGMLKSLSEEEVRAIARYAVIAVAVLPFLPDAEYGPYGAWNPFKLWLVVLLITGFSVAGYIANRVIGESKGTIVTALIGGAYSSTAVTAAFAIRLKEAQNGPFATGIALASALMYLRVVLLASIIAPAVALPILWLLGPAAATTFVLTWLIWRKEQSGTGPKTSLTSKPFALLPALGFLLAVAAASLLVRWAQVEFGEAGAAISLFIAGSFDVDAAMVAYSTLPRDAVPVAIAAFTLAGTVAINMAFKAAIVFAGAGAKAGRIAGLSLVASLAVLLATLVFRAFTLFG